MAVPTNPSIPRAPLRSRPSSFAQDAETYLQFQSTFVDYLNEIAEFCDLEASISVAAAVLANLTSTFLSNNAGMLVGINSAGDALEGYDAAPDIEFASRIEAIAATINDKAMSPLRTKQAIDALAPDATGWAKITKKTANNSARLAFGASDFDSSKYRDYRFGIRNLLPVTDGVDVGIEPSDDGGSSSTSWRSTATSTSTWSSGLLDLGASVGTAVDETGLSGILNVFDLHGDNGAMFTFDASYVRNNAAVTISNLVGQLQRPSQDAAINRLSFEASSGNLDSGEIVLYGLVI